MLPAVCRFVNNPEFVRSNDCTVTLSSMSFRKLVQNFNIVNNDSNSIMSTMLVLLCCSGICL